MKFVSEDLSHIHWSLPSQLSWKKSLLLTCEILGQLVYKLAAPGKYPLLNKDTLLIPIQMQLSKKQNTFSQFFDPFSKSRINFKHFETKVDPHRFCIFEIKDSKNVAWEIVWKVPFQRTLIQAIRSKYEGTVEFCITALLS